MTPSLRILGLVSVLTLSAAVCPTATADEQLGRLFFTPERRQLMDRQRQLNIQQEKIEVAEDPTLTINGLVTRSNGKRTVWINGVAQNENAAQGDLNVSAQQKTPGNVRLESDELPGKNARVGETVNRNTGETTDVLGDGQITIRRDPPGKASPNP